MTAVTEHVVQGGTLAIRPLQPTIGAEISGVDLTRPLSDAERDQIKAAILTYKVVFFRDQHLDQDQHAAFARRFGPLYTHPSTSKAYADTVPAIHKISATEARRGTRSCWTGRRPRAGTRTTATRAGGWCRPGARCSAR